MNMVDTDKTDLYKNKYIKKYIYKKKNGKDVDGKRFLFVHPYEDKQCISFVLAGFLKLVS